MPKKREEKCVYAESNQGSAAHEADTLPLSYATASKNLLFGRLLKARVPSFWVKWSRNTSIDFLFLNAPTD